MERYGYGGLLTTSLVHARTCTADTRNGVIINNTGVQLRNIRGLVSPARRVHIRSRMRDRLSIRAGHGSPLQPQCMRALIEAQMYMYRPTARGTLLPRSAELVTSCLGSRLKWSSEHASLQAPGPRPARTESRGSARACGWN
jgi:hypothetical protein